MKRICIYPKDVQIITGRSLRYCQELIKHIKMLLNKEKHQTVTIREFCDYMDFPFEDINDMIQ
jgi:DNA helicase TIP49 (TBP-interacting protein)